MKEIIFGVIGITIGTIGILGVFVLLFVGVYFIEKTKCFSAYENFQPQYGLWSKCRIAVDGILTPVDIVRELK